MQVPQAEKKWRAPYLKDKQLKIKLKKKERKDPTAVACHKSVCGTVDGALVWGSSMGRKPVQTFDMMTITSLLQLVKIILCIVIYLMISTTGTSRALCLEVNGIQSLIYRMLTSYPTSLSIHFLTRRSSPVMSLIVYMILVADSCASRITPTIVTWT